MFKGLRRFFINRNISKYYNLNNIRIGIESVIDQVDFENDIIIGDK